MALVFIGLGSNLGDTRANVQQSWQRLGAHTAITSITLSSPYQTAPVGMESDHWFTNGVGVLQTSLSPRDLLQEMLRVEQEMGRDRSKGMDRTVDLDILYYDDVILAEADLEIPHPEISRRLFVLAPLAEVAPDHIHPVLEQSSQMLKRACVGDDVQKGEW
jgi:2-amino-4-hydroxy-6-hydroxymethyldihydropteridine diphosphokinase